MTDARIPLLLTLGLLSAGSARAQNPNDAPAAPDNTASAMYSLEDLYNRLNTGAAGTDPTIPANTTRSFGEPTAGPTGATMKSLNDIMGKMPSTDDSDGAAVDNVLQGKTFWGLTSGGWGLKTGTLAQQTPTAGSVSQSAGIYDAFDLSAVDTDLAAGNIKTGVTLFGIAGSYSSATLSGDAVASDVLTGKTFCNSSGCGNTGTMTDVSTQNITPTTSEQTITAGYHSGSGKVAGDTDLVSSNIKSGVEIFGVTGNDNVIDTAEVTNPVVASRMKTGDVAFVNGNKITGNGTQTLSASNATVSEGYYASTTLTTVDGNLTAGNIKSGATIFGVAGTYDTSPCNCDTGTIWNAGSGGTRWCDNGDGTVTDLLGATVDGKTKGRCLVWLQKADWGGKKPWRANVVDDYDDAHTRAGILSGSTSDAGLSDGSVEEGDWRLPTISELEALTTDPQRILSSTSGPFSGVQTGSYWSSSTLATNSVNVRALYLNSGNRLVAVKYTDNSYVWPVRGGQ